MRIIFSRKGFDSASGGCPSPILGGTPVSLPIPAAKFTTTTFGDLAGPHTGLVADLTRGRYGATSGCHLDPDIDHAVLPRQRGWRGAFGQANAALSHLETHSVVPGDVFLFWGSFREAERKADGWRFIGPTRHLIFGWLQVASYHRIDQEGPGNLATRHPWLSAHPHLHPCRQGPNGIYIATPRLSLPGWDSHLPGWGVLRRGHDLTAPGANPSLWVVPDWLNPHTGGKGMSYHPPSRWSPTGTVQCVARGQEFVACPANPGHAVAWVNQILEAAS